MHIAEGMLPLGWAAAYSGVALPFLAKGVRDYVRLGREPGKKQLLGTLTAAVFVISLLPIPVPIAGTCSHPGGTPLAAILAGPWLATLMGFVALLFQALFLAHGGLTTLGANTLTMGVFGGFVGFLVYRLFLRLSGKAVLAAGLAGFVGDLSIYVGSSLQLALALHGDASWLKVWGAVFAAYLPTQAPLAVLEGVFTGLAVSYVLARRPELLGLGGEGAFPAREVAQDGEVAP